MFTRNTKQDQVKWNQLFDCLSMYFNVSNDREKEMLKEMMGMREICEPKFKLDSNYNLLNNSHFVAWCKAWKNPVSRIHYYRKFWSVFVVFWTTFYQSRYCSKCTASCLSAVVLWRYDCASCSCSSL